MLNSCRQKIHRVELNWQCNNTVTTSKSWDCQAENQNKINIPCIINSIQARHSVVKERLLLSKLTPRPARWNKLSTWIACEITWTIHKAPPQKNEGRKKIHGRKNFPTRISIQDNKNVRTQKFMCFTYQNWHWHFLPKLKLREFIRLDNETNRARYHDGMKIWDDIFIPISK